MQPNLTTLTTLWKAIIRHHLPAFLALFLPVAYADIDWQHGFRWLNDVLDDDARAAGMLVQVECRDGKGETVRLFIRIADARRHDFAARMWQTHLSLYKRFNAMPVSMALLLDDDEAWRPDSFGYDVLGTTLSFVYPVVKLTSYASLAAEAELNGSDNPIAALVLAHLAAQTPDLDDQARAETRRMLAHRLQRLGYHELLNAPELFALVRGLLRAEPEPADEGEATA